MDLISIFQNLGIALGLGLLVGIQRESAASRLAGVRTFPLITIMGVLSAMISDRFGGWTLAAAFIALAGTIFVGKMVELKEPKPDLGLTTEIAMLLMFAVGAYLVVGHKEVAIAVGGGTAVLLQYKGQLHGLVEKLGETDLKAIMQFALLSLVILPVLPNRFYGPYSVLNPHSVWLMVVLIVGINLSGYIAYKFLGEKVGIVLGGVFGGLISSTATTVSYSKRTANAPDVSRIAVIVIMIASAVVFARMIIEIATVAPSFLLVAAPPLLIMLAVLAAFSIGVWFLERGERIEMPAQENPTELRSALMFAVLYAIVLLAVAIATDLFGNRGLYAVAWISGLTDVDAITLSTSQLVGAGRLDPNDGWRVILMAAMSNLIFKAGTVAFLGHRRLLKKTLLFFGMTFAAGIILLIVWPN